MVDRETVGVVQLEGLVTRQGLGARSPGICHRGVEHRGTGAEGTTEGLLLGGGGPDDSIPLGEDVREGSRHEVAGDRQQLR